MSLFNHMLGVLLQDTGIDISVQRYIVSQSGDNPATAIITLDTPVPVGQSFAHIQYKSHHNSGYTAYAVAKLQTVINGYYTECLVLSETEPGYKNSYHVQILTSPDFSVQIASFDQQTGDNNPFYTPITAVDQNHTFIVPSFTGGNQPRRSVTRVHLASNTSVESRAGQSYSDDILSGYHYVVSCDKINVQHGLVTLSSTSATVPVNNNTGNTICLYSYHTEDSIGNSADADFLSVRGHWVDDSLYEFSRFSSDSPLYISFYLITIPQTKLLRIDHDYATSPEDNIENITIPNVGVDMDKVWLAVPSNFGNTAADDGNFRDTLVRHNITSPTNLELSAYGHGSANLITSTQILLL